VAILTVAALAADLEPPRICNHFGARHVATRDEETAAMLASDAEPRFAYLVLKPNLNLVGKAALAD